MNMSAIERYRQRVCSIENDPAYLTEGVKVDFAEELCRLMDESGVSRTQLAERMGVSRAYITRILRTDYNLTAETMVKVALALEARVSLHLHPKATRVRWQEIAKAECAVPAKRSHVARNKPYTWTEKHEAPIVADRPARRRHHASGA